MFNSTLIVETRPILSHFLQIIGLVGTGGFFLPIDVQFNTDCLDKTNFVTFFADDWACCSFAAVAIAKSFEVFTPEVCFVAHTIWNSTVAVAIASSIPFHSIPPPSLIVKFPGSLPWSCPPQCTF